MRISVATRIDRPVADVWRWYAVDHVRNHPRWDPDMQLEQISPEPIGLGTRIRRRNVRWGSAVDGEMEIVEWQPERAIGTRIRDANVEMRGRATFEPLAEGETSLTITADVPALDPSMAAVMRKGIERTAANIKKLIESEI